MPAVDQTKTQMLPPTFPRAALARIHTMLPADVVEEMSDNKRRSFERSVDVVAGLIGSPLQWRVAIYIRGEEPPSQPFWLRPPRLLVLVLRDGMLYVAMALGPRGKAVHESPEAHKLEHELLKLMRWQMAHMPVLPRKGWLHVGMPGIFHVLGLHLSQHANAKNEVEQFGPRNCACSSPTCDLEEDWLAAVSKAREISLEFQSVLRGQMPTENARQVALGEQLLAPYAKHRAVVEKMMLGAQHGLCQSAGNKTSADHGDGGNHAQLNYLTFSTPELIKRRLQDNPKSDLGVWEQEGGELLVALSPRLEIIFNSATGHACIAAKHLLADCNNPEKLKGSAGEYSQQQFEEALKAVRTDPSLMEGFEKEEDAAWYQSSLVGTTTFQQKAVTHQMLRAAAADTLDRCVRARVARVDAKRTKVEAAEAAAAAAIVAAAEAAEEAQSMRARTRADTRAEEGEARKRGEKALCAVCASGVARKCGPLMMVLCDGEEGCEHGVHVGCGASLAECAMLRQAARSDADGAWLCGLCDDDAEALSAVAYWSELWQAPSARMARWLAASEKMESAAHVEATCKPGACVLVTVAGIPHLRRGAVSGEVGSCPKHGLYAPVRYACGQEQLVNLYGGETVVHVVRGGVGALT